ncbi:hypothetical protein [Paenibacillus sp. RUD330]|uniref:hypothetical protein n=1 Tax=Paenibacillus sp. RUD330 TaxID=2023772 RepID=UPI000B92AF39|nr:hypothetical protein [Paenibacillus sp. RUD330]ASS64705.1 hypothetical protein CIC07_00220 [Paenibacillus sp. RUD330]
MICDSTLSIADKPDPTMMFNVDLPLIQFVYYDRTKDGIWVYNTVQDGFLPGALKFWMNMIESTGFTGLFDVDRNLRVNPGHVTLMDQKYAKAFFGDDHSKECSMSDRGFKLLHNFMGENAIDFKFNPNPKIRAAH